MTTKHLSGARWLAFGIAMLTGAAVLIGCSSNTAKVSGKVTVLPDNDALGVGSITFIHEGADPVVINLNADGTYSSSAVPVGECTVTITGGSGEETGKAIGIGNMGTMSGKKGEGDKTSEDLGKFDDQKKKFQSDFEKKLGKSAGGGSNPFNQGSGNRGIKIDKKYAEPTTSGFKVTIKKGKNENVDFQVERAPAGK